MDVLILTLEAPLMSFGGVMVDARGPTEDHPGLAMLTGLLGNALGFDHVEADRLERLQQRLRFASRCDVAGQRLRDYHTVDLGDRAGPQEVRTKEAPYAIGSAAPNLAHGGWTTRGVREDRDGAKDTKFGTHIRDRHYHADRVQVVALTLDPSEEDPTLEECVAALKRPARPLFIGRKTCLPSRPIFSDRIEYESLRAALASWPRHPRSRRPDDTSEAADLDAWWPASETAEGETTLREMAMVDRRDWRNQLVVGRRLLHHGTVHPPFLDQSGSNEVQS